MYIAEVAPRRIRGGLVSFNQLMIVGGILIAYIVDFLFKGVAGDWRWMLGLGAVPGVALAVGMMLMPHSPRWLMERGRDAEARAVLERVHRRGEGIDIEMDDIRRVVAEEGSLRDIIGAKVRPMLVVGLALAVFQQIVGINTVIYYAPTILRFTGATVSSAITQTVFIGLTNVVFTIVAVLLPRPFRTTGFRPRRHGWVDRFSVGAGAVLRLV
jgi:MFS family permease